ncbi:MAG: DUF2452 domain-containing protein [Bacteroidia bacterium]
MPTNSTPTHSSSDSSSSQSSSSNGEHDPHSVRWGLSEVPMHVGSAMIRPEDRGKIKAVALQSAHNQAQQQMSMLKRQAEALMEEARRIEERLRLSAQIFEADVNFTPVVGQIYHLYNRGNGTKFLSLVGHRQWSERTKPLEHLGTFRYLADSTWEPFPGL